MLRKDPLLLLSLMLIAITACNGRTHALVEQHVAHGEDGDGVGEVPEVDGGDRLRFVLVRSAGGGHAKLEVRRFLRFGNEFIKG